MCVLGGFARAMLGLLVGGGINDGTEKSNKILRLEVKVQEVKT